MNEELFQKISKEVGLRKINIRLNTVRHLIELGANKADISLLSKIAGKKFINLSPDEAHELHHIEKRRKILFCYDQERFGSNYQHTKIDRFSYGFNQHGLPSETKALMRAF